MRNGNGQSRRGGRRTALFNLLAHLFMTSVVFSAIFVLAWCVSFLGDWLHAVHPFPVETYRFLAIAKRWLVYFDVALLAAGLVSGATRFIKETWEAP